MAKTGEKIVVSSSRLQARSYDDILEAAKKRIPGYTPEWTDFNASDPGHTLLEIFAWLSETFLWELEQVPEKSFEAFLDLINLPQAPAEAASTILSVDARNIGKPALVPQKSPFSAPAGDGGEPIVFETEEGFAATPLALKALLSDDGTIIRHLPLIKARGPGQAFEPFGDFARQGSAFIIGLGEGLEAGEACSDLFPDMLSLYVAVAANATLPGEFDTTTNAIGIGWEYLADSSGGEVWQDIKIIADETSKFRHSGLIKLAKPAGIKALPLLGAGDTPRCWLRCRILYGHFPRSHRPRFDKLVLNCVRASNLATVKGEVLGKSNGRPFQSFKLFHTPIAAGTLKLSVRDPSGTGQGSEWRQTNDIYSAGRGEAAYALDVDTGTITFGDETTGMIPKAGSDIIALQYRYGGGSRGNIGANAVNTVMAVLDGITDVTNVTPALGGAERPGLNDRKKSVPNRLRNRGRAVTKQDYFDLAIESGLVSDVSVEPNKHPLDPERTIPGAVTIVAAPRQDLGSIDQPITPPRFDMAKIQALQAKLDAKRTVSTELYVIKPQFHLIKVACSLKPVPGKAPESIKQLAKDAINRFIAPLLPETSGDLTNLCPSGLFGRCVFVSNIVGVLDELPEIAAVQSLKVYVDGVLVENVSQPIIEGPYTILWPELRHMIDVSVASEGIAP